MQDSFTSRYGDWEQWHWWFRGRRRIIESILGHELNSVRPRTILSVGCGPAEGLSWLLPFAGPEGKVIGLDIEPRHARQYPNGVCFVNGELQKAPLVNGSFDVVLALDVLEHLEDDSAGLLEAVRLLKKGGLLVITVPALPSLWGGQDVVSHHYRRYTRKSLSYLFEQAHLSGYEMNYFNSILFPLAALVRWTRRAFGLAQRQRSDFEDNHPGLINEILARVLGAESLLIARIRMPVGVSLVGTYRAPI